MYIDVAGWLRRTSILVDVSIMVDVIGGVTNEGDIVVCQNKNTFQTKAADEINAAVQVVSKSTCL